MVTGECHPRGRVEQSSGHKNKTKYPFRKPPIYGENAEDYKAEEMVKEPPARRGKKL